MTHFADAIHYICAHSKVDANLVAAVCKIIQVAPEDEKVDLFVRFLYECNYTPTDKCAKIYEEYKEDIPRKEQIVAKTKINNFISSNKEKGLTETAFHGELLQFVFDESQGDHRKCIAFMIACIQNLNLPYVNITNALTMSQDEFEGAESKIDQLYIGMIKHISKQNFSQVSELASKYVPILDMVDNQKEKTILLTLMLMRFRARTSRLSLADLLDDD